MLVFTTWSGSSRLVTLGSCCPHWPPGTQGLRFHTRAPARHGARSGEGGQASRQRTQEQARG